MKIVRFRAQLAATDAKGYGHKAADHFFIILDVALALFGPLRLVG